MRHSLRIFSDFSCPFCYIAKAMIASLGADLDPSIIWVPMELHPEIPPEGVLLSDFAPDMDPESFQRDMNAKAEPYGIRFGEFFKAYNSGRAIRAAEFARDAGLFESFHAAVFKKLFTEGQNIADPFVLRRIAMEEGLDPDVMDQAIDEGIFESRLRTSAIEAAERGIFMAPTFILPGSSTPLPGLPAKERLLAMLKDVSKK